MARLEAVCEWEFDLKAAAEEWPEQNETTSPWKREKPTVDSVSPWVREKEMEDESSEYAELFAAIQFAERNIGFAEELNGDEALFSDAAFRRAVNFLLDHALLLMERFGIELPVPQIGAGPNGSVDLHWQLPSWELLVNIPAPENGLAAYYGDNYAEQKTRGVFDPSEVNLGLMTWLLHK